VTPGARGDGRLIVRAGAAEDQPAVLALNNAAAPSVNVLTDEQLTWLTGEADYYRIAERAGRLAGFVIAIRSGTSYWSGNYAWFSARYSAFLYVDRVVVAAPAQRSGVGRALYADLLAFANGRWPRITLEVNLRPSNPGSIAFHEAMGFQQVGRRAYDDNEVAMFELPVTALPVGA
jgi:predicted GNAT superfamily acetyltransferase